jgi:hypothetical protein
LIEGIEQSFIVLLPLLITELMSEEECAPFVSEYVKLLSKIDNVIIFNNKIEIDTITVFDHKSMMTNYKVFKTSYEFRNIELGKIIIATVQNQETKDL